MHNNDEMYIIPALVLQKYNLWSLSRKNIRNGNKKALR